MTHQDFYKYFLYDSRHKLKFLHDTYVSNLDIAIELYEEIQSLFNLIHPDFKLALERIELGELSFISPTDHIRFSKYSKLNKFDEIQIKTYLKLRLKTLPSLRREIKLTYLKANMPWDVYKHIIESYNLEVSKAILSGYSHNFKCGIAPIYISVGLRSDDHKVVDWDRSNKLKALLIQNGRSLYSEKNLSGEKWIIFRLDSKYLFWRWAKTRCVIPNYSNYSFKTTSFIHTYPERTIECTKKLLPNEEDILNTFLLGNRQKMLRLSEIPNTTIYKLFNHDN